MCEYLQYQKDSKVWCNYFEAEDDKFRCKAHEAAFKKKNLISDEVWKALQEDLEIHNSGK